jgi:hypothetical protein
LGDRDPQSVVDVLRELSRKELVRPARRSSMQGEAEYAFWHVLTRDVAYTQLPPRIPRLAPRCRRPGFRIAWGSFGLRLLIPTPTQRGRDQTIPPRQKHRSGMTV